MSRTTSMLGVVGVAVGLWLGSVEPVGAQTFLGQTQNVVDGECPSSGPVPCVAGIVTSAGQVEVQNEGMAQYVVQRRLQALQCPPDAEARGECSSQPLEGASADEVSFLNGLSLFFSGDYENKDKDANNFEAGFQSNKGGLTVGADKRLGTLGVVGAAISYGHTWGEFDHNDGDFNTDSIGTLIYGSYYPTDQSFIDATVGFAYKFYDVSRGFSMIDGTDQPVEAQGDTTGVEFNTSLSGGYDFTFGAFTVGPRLGLNYIQTHYDAFTENNNPLGLSYGDQKEDSLTTTAGVQMSYAISTDFGVVVPQVSAEYVHEFLNDQHTVHAVSAATPTVDVSYLTEKPDRNYAHVGAGVVFVLPEGCSPYLNYRAEVANSNETVQTVTVGLRIELE